MLSGFSADPLGGNILPILKTKIHPYYLSARKPWFDIFFALCVFVLSWPLWLLIGAAIFLESGRPIFFCQRRLGFHKHSFCLYKFRTMRDGAEQKRAALLKYNKAPAPMFKMDHDPRYTRVGAVLSRTGLDELPQFFNILKGEMSLVGPRPLPINEAKKLPASWDFRYAVKPGILSEWAVNEQRYQSLKMWQKLEKETLEHGSIFYDLILFVQAILYIY